MTVRLEIDQADLMTSLLGSCSDQFESERLQSQINARIH